MIPNMRFKSECWVCWASVRDAEFSRSRRKVSFVGETVDFENRRASTGFSGDVDGVTREGFRGDMVVRGGLLVLKKLNASAGFSRMIKRKRRSSLRRSGRPGRRRRTSLVLIRERNKLEDEGRSFRR